MLICSCEVKLTSKYILVFFPNNKCVSRSISSINRFIFFFIWKCKFKIIWIPEAVVPVCSQNLPHPQTISCCIIHFFSMSFLLSQQRGFNNSLKGWWLLSPRYYLCFAWHIPLFSYKANQIKSTETFSSKSSEQDKNSPAWRVKK